MKKVEALETSMETTKILNDKYQTKTNDLRIKTIWPETHTHEDGTIVHNDVPQSRGFTAYPRYRSWPKEIRELSRRSSPPWDKRRKHRQLSSRAVKILRDPGGPKLAPHYQEFENDYINPTRARCAQMNKPIPRGPSLKTIGLLIEEGEAGVKLKYSDPNASKVEWDDNDHYAWVILQYGL